MVIIKVKSNLNVSLTENYAIYPPSSISGLYFYNKEAKYFSVGKINEQQFEIYSDKWALILKN